MKNTKKISVKVKEALKKQTPKVLSLLSLLAIVSLHPCQNDGPDKHSNKTSGASTTSSLQIPRAPQSNN